MSDRYEAVRSAKKLDQIIAAVMAATDDGPLVSAINHAMRERGRAFGRFLKARLALRRADILPEEAEDIIAKVVADVGDYGFQLDFKPETLETDMLLRERMIRAEIMEELRRVSEQASADAGMAHALKGEVARWQELALALAAVFPMAPHVLKEQLAAYERKIGASPGCFMAHLTELWQTFK